MVQTRNGVAAALPLHLENRKLAELIYGADSVAVGQAEHILGQTYVMLQDIGAAHTHIQLARDILLKHLGEDAQEVKEATQFIRLVEATVARDAQEQQAVREQARAAQAAASAATAAGRGRLNGLSRVAAGKRTAINGASAAAALSTPQPPRTHGEKVSVPDRLTGKRALHADPLPLVAG